MSHVCVVMTHGRPAGSNTGATLATVVNAGERVNARGRHPKHRHIHHKVSLSPLRQMIDIRRPVDLDDHRVDVQARRLEDLGALEAAPDASPAGFTFSALSSGEAASVISS